MRILVFDLFIWICACFVHIYRYNAFIFENVAIIKIKGNTYGVLYSCTRTSHKETQESVPSLHYSARQNHHPYLKKKKCLNGTKFVLNIIEPDKKTTESGWATKNGALCCWSFITKYLCVNVRIISAFKLFKFIR